MLIKFAIALIVIRTDGERDKTFTLNYATTRDFAANILYYWFSLCQLKTLISIRCVCNKNNMESKNNYINRRPKRDAENNKTKITLEQILKLFVPQKHQAKISAFNLIEIGGDNVDGPGDGLLNCDSRSNMIEKYIDSMVEYDKKKHRSFKASRFGFNQFEKIFAPKVQKSTIHYRSIRRRKIPKSPTTERRNVVVNDFNGYEYASIILADKHARFRDQVKSSQLIKARKQNEIDLLKKACTNLQSINNKKNHNNDNNDDDSNFCLQYLGVDLDKCSIRSVTDLFGDSDELGNNKTSTPLTSSNSFTLKDTKLATDIFDKSNDLSLVISNKVHDEDIESLSGDLLSQADFNYFGKNDSIKECRTEEKTIRRVYRVCDLRSKKSDSSNENLDKTPKQKQDKSRSSKFKLFSNIFNWNKSKSTPKNELEQKNLDNNCDRENLKNNSRISNITKQRNTNVHATVSTFETENCGIFATEHSNLLNAKHKKYNTMSPPTRQPDTFIELPKIKVVNERNDNYEYKHKKHKQKKSSKPFSWSRKKDKTVKSALLAAGEMVFSIATPNATYSDELVHVKIDEPRVSEVIIVPSKELNVGGYNYIRINTNCPSEDEADGLSFDVDDGSTDEDDRNDREHSNRDSYDKQSPERHQRARQISEIHNYKNLLNERQRKNIAVYVENKNSRAREYVDELGRRHKLKKKTRRRKHRKNQDTQLHVSNDNKTVYESKSRKEDDDDLGILDNPIAETINDVAGDAIEDLIEQNLGEDERSRAIKTVDRICMYIRNMLLCCIFCHKSVSKSMKEE